MPYPKTRTFFERVPVNEMAPPPPGGQREPLPSMSRWTASHPTRSLQRPSSRPSDGRVLSSRSSPFGDARIATPAHARSPRPPAPPFARERSPTEPASGSLDTSPVTKQGQSRGPLSRRSRLPLPDIGSHAGAVSGSISARAPRQVPPADFTNDVLFAVAVGQSPAIGAK
jgi:hypothetical protein